MEVGVLQVLKLQDRSCM